MSKQTIPKPISDGERRDRLRLARAIEALPHLARRGGRTAPLKATEADREIDPPPLIWTLGHPSLLSKPCVAVDGARIASASGQRFTRQLALELGEAGYVVVSGQARGVDGAAHEGALSTGTAAVLAGGLDDINPPEHEALYRRIASAGCLVSETLWDGARRPRIFPAATASSPASH